MTVGAVSVGRHKTHQNKTQTCKPGDVVIDDADIFLEDDTRKSVSTFIFQELKDAFIYGYYEHNDKRVGYKASAGQVRVYKKTAPDAQVPRKRLRSTGEFAYTSIVLL